jgi:hypothetical protein
MQKLIRTVLHLCYTTVADAAERCARQLKLKDSSSFKAPITARLMMPRLALISWGSLELDLPLMVGDGIAQHSIINYYTCVGLPHSSFIASTTFFRKYKYLPWCKIRKLFCIITASRRSQEGTLPKHIHSYKPNTIVRIVWYLNLRGIPYTQCVSFPKRHFH